jgi:hypothetical protein
MRVFTRFALAALPLLSAPALAGDFDGSRLLICAPVVSHDCAQDECVRGTPEDVGAPAFMRIDFTKKAVIGPKTTSPIRQMEKQEAQLLLQGNEAGFGWTIALDKESGKMSVTLVNREGAFVLFGSCTPI